MKWKENIFSLSALPVLGLALFGSALTLGVFNGGLWAILGLGIGVLAGTVYFVSTKRIPRPQSEVLSLVLVFLLLVVVGAVFSPFPQTAFGGALQWASILLPLSMFAVPEISGKLYHPKMITLLPYLFILALLALALELAAGLPVLHLVEAKKLFPYFYNRGFSYGMILVWPLAGFLWIKGKKRRALILAAATLPALFLTVSRATQMATVLAAAACLISFIAPLIVQRGLQAVLALSVAWPWMAQYLFANKHEWVEKLPKTWGDRAEIWDYFSYRINERLLQGWGVGVDHLLPFAEPHGELYLYRHAPASHPHNVFVQLWLEAGIGGAMLGLAFGWLSLRWTTGLPDRLRPFGIAAWTACFALSLCAYDFSTDSLWAAFAMVSLMLTMFKHELD